MTNEHLRYPVGKFKAPVSYTSEDLRHWIATIKTFPGKLRHAIIGLNEKQLDTPYRPGGWTIRQLIHHVADSHMNSLLRIKWTLTEENPTIKPYSEADWALLPDYKLPVEPSLKIIEGVHQHWTALLESFTENEWARTYIHPESGDTVNLKKVLGLYDWHCRHHLAHITEATKKI
jgi:hypothetical protein